MGKELSQQIKSLLNDDMLSYTDIHFARFIEGIHGDDPLLFLTSALVSSQTRYGNVCLDLTNLRETLSRSGLSNVDALKLPEHDHWIQQLKQSPVVGTSGSLKPLILENDSRIYLYRYWEYQKILSEFILSRARVCKEIKPETRELVRSSLTRLFPGENDGTPDNQKIAAYISCVRQLSVISGGPGTGKTTTVTKILALLTEQNIIEYGRKDLKILMAAPTGKAAARLRESIISAKKTIDLHDEINKRIPEETSTIHRMLGTISGSPYFRFNDKRKLVADVVVIDEASMVDIALMSKLVAAVPSKAKLILLGDQNQLSSVEAGSVLGDICNTGFSHGYSPGFSADIQDMTECCLGPMEPPKNLSPVGDCIAVLDKSYRFGSQSGIGALSRAAQSGDPACFESVAGDISYKDVTRIELPDPDKVSVAIQNHVISGYGPYLRAGTIQEKFEALEAFRVLTVVRKGSYGLDTLNHLIETILAKEGLIRPVGPWYHGRPVMITQNDYTLGLFNGDVGITSASGKNKNSVQVCFCDSDGQVRRFNPNTLPGHETAYAMTVHKCQGSEFDKLLFILPDRELPLLTRELIYTGITRARKHVDIMGCSSMIRIAVSRKTTRNSGLRDALWGQT